MEDANLYGASDEVQHSSRSRVMGMGFRMRIPIRDGRTMMWWAWVALLALQHGRTAAHAQRLRSFVK